MFFVGFMGAGKSTVAQMLGQQLGLPVVDMDEEIQNSAGKTIAQIFCEEGEEAFRRAESALLVRLAQGSPQLIACGGGVVLRADNVRCMQQAGCVVYLQSTAQDALNRIKHVQSRPLLGAIQEMEDLLLHRLSSYERAAEITINTSGCSVEMVVNKVREELVRTSVVIP